MENISANVVDNRGVNFGPIFIAIAATTWTMDFVSRNIVLEAMDATMMVMFEHIIMTLIVLPILWRSRHLVRQFNRTEWFALGIIGIGASALATVALTTGYALGFFQYAPIVALTQQLQPVIAIGLAHFALKENLPKYYYPLSLVAIGGVFLMYYPTVSGLSLSLVDNIGLQAAMYGLLAATLWGTGTVLGKYMLVHSDTDVNYQQMASFRFAIGMIALIIFNALISFPINTAMIDSRIILNLFFIALVPGLFALVLYYYGLKSTHASVATLFELAFPLSFFIFVPILSFSIFGDEIKISLLQYFGAGLLILSTTTLSYLYGKQTSPDQFEFEDSDDTSKFLND